MLKKCLAMTLFLSLLFSTTADVTKVFANVLTTPFAEEFSYGMGGWSTSGGSWSVGGGKLKQEQLSGWGHNSSVQGVTSQDVEVEFDLQVLQTYSDPNDWAGLQLRKTNAPDDHTASGYSILASANGRMVLFKGNGASGQLLKVGYADHDFSSQMRRIKVVVQGSQLRVYASPVTDIPKYRLIIQVIDSSYSSGYFGFITGNTRAEFDNLRVQPIVSGVTIARTNFQDYYQTANLWGYGGGAWSVNNGKIKQTGSGWGHTTTYKRQSALDNFQIQVPLRVLQTHGDPTDWAGVQVRKSRPSDNHTASGYSVLAGGDGRMILMKGGPNGLQVLRYAYAPFNFQSAERMLKVVVNRNRIQVFAASSSQNPQFTLIMDERDSDFTYREGYVGLITGNATAEFGGVQVDLIDFGQGMSVSELLSDVLAEKGFNLYDPDGPIVVDVLGFNVSNPIPDWVLAQWYSRFTLAGALPASEGSGISYSNQGKKIVRTPIPGGVQFRTEVYGKQEFQDAQGNPVIRSAGQQWPHLLITQDFRSDPVVEMESLMISVDAKLNSATNYMGQQYNPGLHAAQLMMYVKVQDINVNSPGYGDYYWFGVPLYDSRYPFQDVYQAADSGQQHSTNKYIYRPASAEYSNHTLHDHEWLSIRKDILPYILDGLDNALASVEFLRNSVREDFEVTHLNIGWEVTGIFDVSADFKNVSLKSYKLSP